MTEKQFRAKQRRLMKKLISEQIETELFAKLEKAFAAGVIPAEWRTEDNYLLTKAVVDSFCLDRPFKMKSKDNQTAAANLHLFI
jgi:hypothetical protein